MNPRFLSKLSGTVAILAIIALATGCKSGPKEDGQQDSLVITPQTTDSEIIAHRDTQHIKSETVIPPADSTGGENRPQQAQSPVSSNLPPAPDFVMDSAKKYIYLTFDDGPQPGTMNVYHILRQYGINATFFMVGLHATYGKTMRSYVDTIRNSYPEILLANHSYTHANGHYMSFYHHEVKCFNDFMKAQHDLKVERKYIRLPGNSGWVLSSGMSAHDLVRPVCKLLDSAGYSVFGWDLEWSFKRDPSGSGSVPVQSADKMVQKVEYAVAHHHTHRKNALVLLSHDRMFHRQRYADSLSKFIRVLKARHPNYVFETVENYPGAKRN